MSKDGFDKFKRVSEHHFASHREKDLRAWAIEETGQKLTCIFNSSYNDEGTAIGEFVYATLGRYTMSSGWNFKTDSRVIDSGVVDYLQRVKNECEKVLDIFLIHDLMEQYND